MIREQPLHGRLDRGPLLLAYQPVVGGDGRLLRLDERALDRIELVAKLRGHAVEGLFVTRRRLVLDRTPLGAPDVEPVAACDHQVVDTRQCLHDGTIATADNADGAAARQPAHRIPHALGDHRILGPVDDRRERAVVVEEHGRPPAGQLLAELLVIRERVRQVGDASPPDAHPSDPLSSSMAVAVPAALSATSRSFTVATLMPLTSRPSSSSRRRPRPQTPRRRRGRR